MQIEVALTTFLETALAMSVYPIIQPQDAPFPYVVYSMAIEEPEKAILHVDFDKATVTIDAYSEGYDKCWELTRLARVAIRDFKGLMAGPTGVRVESADFIGASDGYDYDIGSMFVRSTYEVQYLPE